MSWFDDLVSTGKSLLGGAIDWLTSGTTGANLVKTALTGYALNKVQNSINKQNTPKAAVTSTVSPDAGVRIQVPPSTDYKIPVVYGSATFGGVITDAKLSTNNQIMYYVITLCERTGTLLSTSAQSTFVFNDIFLNDGRAVFQNDGITVDYVIDREGNQDISLRGLVQIYCYAGNSSLPVVPEYYTNGSLGPAYNIMPGWNSSYTMTDTVFAIVKITYNKDKGVVRLPDCRFSITNSMSLPGDCLYDYMTNTRYGAAIPAAEITV